MNEIAASSNTGKLSFGLLATLWAASNGMGALCLGPRVACRGQPTCGRAAAGRHAPT
jgi:hypothetical protein